MFPVPGLRNVNIRIPELPLESQSKSARSIYDIPRLGKITKADEACSTSKRLTTVGKLPRVSGWLTASGGWRGVSPALPWSAHRMD